MGIFDVISGIFSNDYDIRARVLIEDGRVANCRIPIKASFVDSDELKHVAIREIEWKLNSKVKRVIKMYDANEV
jgi:hypothetical protein